MSLLGKDMLQDKKEPVRFRNLDDTGKVNLDLVGTIWPLRILQLLGLWHPSYVPRAVAWVHYLIFFGLSLWFTIWKIYFVANKFDIAVGFLRGFDAVLFLMLWLFVPFWFVIYRRGRAFMNTIDYLISHRPNTKFAITYTIAFIFLLVPQLCYAFLINRQIVNDGIARSLPWSQPTGVKTVDTVILMIGMTLNVICINASLLFIAISSHLQSFQINDILEDTLTRGNLKISHVKQILHLVVQSLREGNNALETLNGVLVLGLLVAVLEVCTRLIVIKLWDVNTLLPLILILIQIYFFLLPPAYVSHCWDNVFRKCLQLHAIALNLEDELGAIIIYMKYTYTGYHVANVRVDMNKILYFTYAVVGLLVVKAQQDSDLWVLE